MCFCVKSLANSLTTICSGCVTSSSCSLILREITFRTCSSLISCPLPFPLTEKRDEIVRSCSRVIGRSENLSFFSVLQLQPNEGSVLPREYRRSYSPDPSIILAMLDLKLSTNRVRLHSCMAWWKIRVCQELSSSDTFIFDTYLISHSLLTLVRRAPLLP